jgi:hypothetical protein
LISILEPYSKFSALLAKKICYLRLLSPWRGLRSSAWFALKNKDLSTKKIIAQAAAVTILFCGQETPSFNISSFNDQSECSLLINI